MDEKKEQTEKPTLVIATITKTTTDEELHRMAKEIYEKLTPKRLG
ncbi:MAG: hypothetical protein ABR961_11370 [Thermoanaerobaculaceae bacterium]|jgi:hypothetical protein